MHRANLLPGSLQHVSCVNCHISYFLGMRFFLLSPHLCSYVLSSRAELVAWPKKKRSITLDENARTVWSFSYLYPNAPYHFHSGHGPFGSSYLYPNGPYLFHCGRKCKDHWIFRIYIPTVLTFSTLDGNVKTVGSIVFTSNGPYISTINGTIRIVWYSYLYPNGPCHFHSGRNCKDRWIYRIYIPTVFTFPSRVVRAKRVGNVHGRPPTREVDVPICKECLVYILI